MATSQPNSFILQEKGIHDEMTPDIIANSKQQKKRCMTYLKYDIETMSQMLEIPEEKILFSSKKIPKGWNRSKYYPNQSLKSLLAHRIITTVIRGKISSLDELKNHYLSILHMGGVGTPEECAFIRYARNYLIRK